MSARPSSSERNAAILARHNAGESLSDIGRDYGMTRERARQIVAKLGGVPKRTTLAERNAEIVATIKANDFTVEQANAHFDRNVYYIGKEAGHTFRREYLYTSPEIVALAEKVRAGMSIRAAACGDGRLVHLVRYYCKKVGIVSQAKTRRSTTMCDRAAIITDMRKRKSTVIIASNAKEAARLNYGKAPASAIAFAHGVSRNSIIGHWFRLRKQGLLA